MNPATINSSTVRLRKQGSGTDVPASVSYAGTTATLDPNADLDPSAVYNVTVAGTVTDANGIALGADDTWSFTTAALSFNFTDTTVSDFGAGTPDADTYVSETGNGEVILKPTEGQEFSGSSLPAGWESCTWPAGPLRTCSPGGATVSGGSLHVDGAFAGTNATFGSGRSLEFVATFGAAAFQHVGFAVDVNNVGELGDVQHQATTTNQILARTNVGGSDDRDPRSRASRRHAAPLPDRVGHDEVRYYVDGNRPRSRPTPRTSAPPRCARSPATSTPAAPRSRSTGCG